MCHGYKLASLNWCRQLLPCSNNGKIWFVHDKFLKSYSYSCKKPAKRSHLCICGDSWNFTCSSKTVHTDVARRVFGSRYA